MKDTRSPTVPEIRLIMLINGVNLTSAIAFYFIFASLALNTILSVFGVTGIVLTIAHVLTAITVIIYIALRIESFVCTKRLEKLQRLTNQISLEE